MLTITALYAGLLALLFLALSINVIRYRRGEQVSLGDGGKRKLARGIRAHGNFAEYVPLVLVLMSIAELSQVPAWRIHLIGIMLVVGRLFHAYCFTFTDSHRPTRTGGIAFTFAALLGGAVNCLWVAVV